jgi:hypothetical protein
MKRPAREKTAPACTHCRRKLYRKGHYSLALAVALRRFQRSHLHCRWKARSQIHPDVLKPGIKSFVLSPVRNHISFGCVKEAICYIKEVEKLAMTTNKSGSGVHPPISDADFRRFFARINIRLVPFTI